MYMNAVQVRYTAEVGREASESGGKTLLMAASPQLAQDVRAAFAGVPRVKPQWSDRHLKIMVVGESGLGKSWAALQVLSFGCNRVHVCSVSPCWDMS